jgi:hypothetical protein
MQEWAAPGYNKVSRPTAIITLAANSVGGAALLSPWAKYHPSRV